jgi:hypothetical protein
MKTKIILILGLLAFTFMPAALNAQTALVDSVVNLVERYEKYASFTEDGLSFKESYGVPFANLFVRRNELSVNGYKMQVFNDINEFDNEKYYTLSAYSEKLESVFPTGINVSMNITDLGEVRSLGGYYKRVDIKVIKTIYGLRASDEKIIKKDEKLLFKIKFRGNEGNYSNFKIITIESQKYPLPAEGLHIGLNIQPGISTIGSTGVIAQYENYSNFSYESATGFGFGFEGVYYFENIPFLAVGARLNYRLYKTNLDLTQIQQESSLVEDVDNDKYSLNLNATNLKETISLSFIEIPVFVKGKYDFSGFAYVNHVYANFGPVFLIAVSENILTSGHYELKGYYPDYHIQLFDIPFYGFQTYDREDLKTNSNLKKFTIAAFAEIGLNIPVIRDKISVDFAVNYQKGLLNLSSQQKNYLAAEVGQTNTIIDSRESVNADFLGISFSVMYRLF